jgi:COMPASS component SPP1
VLAAGELKSLVTASKTAEDFKRLGEGVLSPPATPPDANSSPNNAKESGGDFVESETKALQDISRQKDEARAKHQLLKDRMKFVQMVKQAAARTAAEKELKPKEYCGYDSRLEWTEDQFAAWRNSKTGKLAFELETLATEKSGGADVNGEKMDTDELSATDLLDEEEYEVCDRKKCARHLEWAKLAVDDVRFEMSDNGNRMRALDGEEKAIRERAALRAKVAGSGMRSAEGSVEVHGLGITNGDVEMRPAAVVETVEMQAGAA